MATTVYKPVHVPTRHSKINDKVTATIRGSYLWHADESIVVLINKTEEQGLYVQKSKVIIKGKLYLQDN